MKNKIYRLAYSVLVALMATQLASCATARPAAKEALAPVGEGPGISATAEHEIPDVPQRLVSAPVEKAEVPEFAPFAPELSPLKTRLVSISVKNVPLRDALYVIANATGLNLVMDAGVDPESPVTATLSDISAEQALESVLSSVDYFYEIKGNILVIKGMDTRIFEFGQPSLIQDYSVDVGGDILGGTRTGSSEVKGSVSQKMSSDQVSFKLWDALEKNLASMLRLEGGQGAETGAGPRQSFSVNRMTGTIVVTATRKDLNRVEGYITRLKRILSRQVVIEARILEVQLSDGLKYGIDWTFLSGDIDGVGVLGAGTSKFTNVIGDLPNVNINITGGDFTLLLKALKQQGEVNVLSNPRVNIMNGQTALLSVGRKTDFVSKVETNTTGSAVGVVPTLTFTVETSSILSGIVFGIVPYIEEGTGDISLTITPIVSDLVSLESKTVGSVGSNSIELSIPTVDLRELSTTVKVRDGQMVVIGGLIQNKDSVEDNKVPFLGDIPILGALFKSRNKTSNKTELIIMLKSRVVPG